MSARLISLVPDARLDGIRDRRGRRICPAILKTVLIAPADYAAGDAPASIPAWEPSASAPASDAAPSSIPSTPWKTPGSWFAWGRPPGGSSAIASRSPLWRLEASPHSHRNLLARARPPVRPAHWGARGAHRGSAPSAPNPNP